MNPRNAFSRLPKCPKLKLGYPLCPPAASARWEKAMSTARSRQGKHMPVVGASGRRTQDSLPACQPESYLNLVQWVQCQPDTAGRIGGLADHPAPRAGLVRAPLCSLLGPPSPVVTGQSSQQVCFGLVGSSSPGENSRLTNFANANASSHEQIPSTPTRRPSKPGQLTSIARPAICFSVFPTLCHQRSRGELNPEQCLPHPGSTYAISQPVRVPWSRSLAHPDRKPCFPARLGAPEGHRVER